MDLPIACTLAPGEFRERLASINALARDALRSHERAFPRGQLLEERESMRVQALSQAHDFVAARAAGERFRRHFPRSMFLPAVEQALETAP